MIRIAFAWLVAVIAGITMCPAHFGRFAALMSIVFVLSGCTETQKPKPDVPPVAKVPTPSKRAEKVAAGKSGIAKKQTTEKDNETAQVNDERPQTTDPDLSPEVTPPLPPTESAVAAYEAAEKTLSNSVGMTFKLIPPGVSVMRVPESQEYRGGWLIRRKTIPQALYCSIHEVTQRQYQTVMGLNPSKIEGDDLPVTSVRWDEAAKFCRLLSMKEKQTYRLPTEAEWEYFARAGTTTLFHYGDTLSGDQAQFDGRNPFGRVPRMATKARPVSVGSFLPNAFGLYDIHGNVAEWCMENEGLPSSNVYLLRGGGFRSSGMELLSGRRAAYNVARDDIGFRVIRELTPLPRDRDGGSTPERWIEQFDAAVAAAGDRPPRVVFLPVRNKNHGDGVDSGGALVAAMAQAAAASLGGGNDLPRILPDGWNAMNATYSEGAWSAFDEKSAESLRMRLGADFTVSSEVVAPPTKLLITVRGPGLPPEGLQTSHVWSATNPTPMAAHLARDTLTALNIAMSPEMQADFDRLLTGIGRNPLLPYSDLQDRFSMARTKTGRGVTPLNRILKNSTAIPAWCEYLTHYEHSWRAQDDFNTLQGPLSGTELARVTNALMNGKLEDALELALSAPPRYRRSPEWYRSVLMCAEALEEERFINHVVAKFEEACPGYDGNLVRGEFLLNWAWKARGTGTADMVAEADWKRFEERLTRAIPYFDAAIEAFPQDWVARANLIRVSTSLGLTPETPLRLFTEGVAHRPDAEPLYDGMFYYLQPRWHGSPDQLLMFAEYCAKSNQWNRNIPQRAIAAVKDATLTMGELNLRKDVMRSPQLWKTLQAIQAAAQESEKSLSLRTQRDEMAAFAARWGVMAGHAQEVADDFLKTEQWAFDQFEIHRTQLRFLRDHVVAVSGQGFSREIAAISVALSANQLTKASELIEMAAPTNDEERQELARVKHALAQAQQLQERGELTITPADMLKGWLVEGEWREEGEWLVPIKSGKGGHSVSCPFGFGPAEITGKCQSGESQPITVVSDARHLDIPLELNWFPAQEAIQLSRLRRGLAKRSTADATVAFRCLRTLDSIEWEWGDAAFEPMTADLTAPAGFAFIPSHMAEDDRPDRLGTLQIRLLKTGAE